MAGLSSVSNANVSIQLTANGSLNIASLQQPVSGGMNVNPTDLRYNFGTGATAGNVDEVVSLIEGTITASGNVTLDLSAGLTDICNQTATVARIRAITVELLNASQDSNGTACSSITLGDAASNAWVGGPLTSTFVYKIKNGGKLVHTDATAAGMLVGSAKNLKIVNNDGAIAALYRITLFGAHS